MELKGVLLCQPWGMYGVRGLAARLYAKVQRKYLIDPMIPYGEFIIGGDMFYETYVVSKDEYVNSFFKSLTAKELGETAYSEFGNTLPFSIKILSLRTPAPLLCYPSEEMGNLLHRKNAKRYLTAGVRHEVVIALRDFSFLLGFRTLDFITEVLENVPEFKFLVDETLIRKFLKTKDKKDFLEVFKRLLDNLPSQTEYAGKLLRDKLLNSAPSRIAAFHPLKLFEELFRDNPSDVGIFMPYFLNVVKLKRLEAMIIPAETPYTYLYGQALQCSNTVENAPSAAFCTRRDLDSFCDSLDLRFWTNEDILDLKAEIRSVKDDINEYLTPSPYYRVFIGTIPKKSNQSIPRLSSFSIVFIIEGNGNINNHSCILPGAALLFYKKEKITFNTVTKVLFVQVSINLLV